MRFFRIFNFWKLTSSFMIFHGMRPINLAIIKHQTWYRSLNSWGLRMLPFVFAMFHARICGRSRRSSCSLQYYTENGSLLHLLALMLVYCTAHSSASRGSALPGHNWAPWLLGLFGAFWMLYSMSVAIFLSLFFVFVSVFCFIVFGFWFLCFFAAPEVRSKICKMLS